MRRRQSLGGTERLREDPVPQLALHGVAHDQVDAAAEDLLEPALNTEEVEQADGLVEVDEEVDVAGGAGLAARDRAEEVERTDAQRRELWMRRSKSLDGLPTGHVAILGLPTDGSQQPPRLPRTCARAGLAKRLTTHDLRLTFASHLVCAEWP